MTSIAQSTQASRSVQQRTPRAEANRAALIDAGERLFGRSGFDAVSIREIGAAVGSANTNVVGYYFGSKDEFILSIFRSRLSRIENRRAELLAIADASGQGNDLPTLFDVLWRPLFEQTDENGDRIFAAFLNRLILDGLDLTRQNLIEDYWGTCAVVNRIEPYLPYTKGSEWDLRWNSVSILVLSAFSQIKGSQHTPEATAQRKYSQVLTMGLAALTAENLAR